MAKPFQRLRRFLSELRRRNVYRVAVTYAVVAFVVWQVANLLFPALGFPAWTIDFVIVLTLLGFPLALVLAWAFEMTPEGMRRTGEAEPVEEVEGPASGTRTGYRILVGLGLVGAAVAGGWYLTGGGSSTPEPIVPGVEELDASRVAVFPFAVRGGEELGHWGEGMVELLSRSLDGAGSLQAVDPNTLLSRVGNGGSGGLSPDSIRRTAARLGAGRYVRGSIYRLGDSLQLSATWYRVEGGPVGSAEVTAGGESEIHAMVDELARSAVADLARGEVGRRRLAAQTTSSVEALKAYLEGQEAFRAYNFQAAQDSFSRSLEADSSFALAHYRLSLATGWSGLDLRRGHRAARRAVELSGDLPEEVRTLLRANAAFISGEAVRAEKLYRTLLQSHPDHSEAWYMLGETLFHYNGLRGRPASEAREPFRRTIKLNPNSNMPLVHLVQLALLEDDRERADSLTSGLEARGLAPFIENAFRAVRANVLMSGPDSALVRGVRRGNPWGVGFAAYVLMAGGHHLQGVYDLHQLLAAPDRPEEARAAGVVRQASVLAAQGKLEAAREKVRRVAALDTAEYWMARARHALFPFRPERPSTEERTELREGLRGWNADEVPERLLPATFLSPRELYPAACLYYLGLLRASVADYTGAIQTAEELRAMDAPLLAPSGPADLARSIRAEVERRQGQREASLEELRRWEGRADGIILLTSPHSAARERFLRAELLAEQGEYEEALRWYGTLNGLDFAELPYLAPARRGEARALEELGRAEEAIEAYRRVIGLWQDADSILQPRVEEAREALARLTSDTTAASSSAGGTSPPR